MNSRDYDFILFENAHQLENHYKDLELLAILLQTAGYKVVIANIFKERALCIDNRIPHLDLKHMAPSSLRQLSKYRNKISSLRYSYLKFLTSIYLIYVLFSLRKKTNYFYIGSLTIDTPIFWLMMLPYNNKYFIWGVRSYVLQKWKERFFERFGLYSYSLYKIIKSQKKIKIITSNEIIRKEFNNIGFSDDRIIVRPERTIPQDYTINTTAHKSEIKTFLTFGTLRRNKHVEIVLDALRQLNDDTIKYIIAGRCRDSNGYNELIEDHMKGLNNVERIDRYISNEEYESLLSNTDFFVICDEPEKSCGTNGTFMEAILHRIPVIAPNHEPFITEIAKDEIGLIYEFNDVNSLASCITMAKTKGKQYFVNNISKHIEMYAIKDISKGLRNQIRRSICC